ncbi:hypothetical protein BKA83DRAFT_4476700 [Pisolithus microcarpus]|nr:hypothetical protein BKA83DRAFT_4476700 [Pisolithus microcarpus]
MIQPGGKVPLVFGALVMSETRLGHSKEFCLGTGESTFSEMDRKEDKKSLTFRPPPAPPVQHNDAGSTWDWKSQRILVTAVNAVADVAVAAQLERLRVTEALAACDNAVTGISYHISFGTRTRDSQAVGDPFIIGLQWIQCSDYCTGAEDQTDDEKGVNSARYVRSDSPSSRVRIATPSKTTCLGGHAARTSRASDKPVPIVNDDPKEKISSLSLEDGVEKIVTARNSVLAALPLPSDIPEEELQPILPPHSYSLGDFNTTGVRVIFQRTRSTYRHVKTLKDSRSSFPSRSL